MQRVNHFRMSFFFKSLSSLLWKTQFLVKLNKFIWSVKNDGTNYKTEEYNIESCFSDIPTNHLDHKIKRSFLKVSKQWDIQKNKITYVFGKIFIDSDRGLAMFGLNKLISFTRCHGYVFPNLLSYQLHKILGKYKKLDTAIHFDGYQGENYYHFFHDAVNSYWTLIKIPDYQTIPVLIGKRVWDKPYVKYFLENSELRKLNWYVIEKDWLKVNQLIKPNASDKNWIKTSHLLRNDKDVIKPNRRVFLMRPIQHGRYITNLDALKPVLAKYQFSIIDASELTPSEQVKLFKETAFLIGIHGAGLTNILFSQHEELNMLEIFPDGNSFYPHYFWLSGILGISYDAMAGGKPNRKLGFRVEPRLLEEKIKLLLSRS